MTGSPEQNARPGRWKRRLLALGISFLVSAAAAELVVRLVRGAPLPERTPISRVEAHPTRGWAMIPSEDHYTYENLVEINSHGLRGPEIPDEKEPGEVRILALGDSMTYGQGVAGDQTLPAHLERLLGERDEAGRRWRVINSGHRAYSTNQELALLEELGPRLKPDLVIVLWYWNDLIEHDLTAKYEELVASGPIAFDAGAPLEGFVAWKWRVTQLARRSALAMYVHDLLRDATEKRPQAEYFEDKFPALDEHLGRMVELAGEHGWRLLFAAVPDSNTLVRQHLSLGLANRAAELAAARGFEVVDLLPSLKELTEKEGRRPILRYDGHYEGAGNEVMAEVLAEQVLAEE